MATKQQSTMFDTTIEDPELEALLAEQVKLEPVATEYRKTKKSIRQHIEKEHADLIASPEDVDDDDEDESNKPSGWVLCGGYRFRPKAVPRAEGKVQIKAGVNWTCPVERVT